jgi:hypothetical protein
MIYCYGKRSTYDAGLSQPKPFIKLGRGSIDPEGNAVLGGAVFQFRQEAENFLFRMGRQGRERGVFGIEADWAKDTYHIEGEGHNRLLRDARIVKLDNQKKVYSYESVVKAEARAPPVSAATVPTATRPAEPTVWSKLGRLFRK